MNCSSPNALFTPSYETMECLTYPSTPPRRRKMKVSIEDEHVVIPLKQESGDLMVLKVPVADFPSMPFEFPEVRVKEHSEPPEKPASASTPPTTQSSNKLQQTGPKKSLSHLQRRRRSIGARCA
ncbi:hypothetical protein ACHAWF_005319 [Thalassiosira exigua]